MRRSLIAATALATALGSAAAGATVLYKLTDPLGRITYADVVPRGFEGAVTRIDVDTTTTAVSPSRIPDILAQSPADTEIVIRRAAPTYDERVRAAQLRLDNARAALDDAQNNSLAEDWIYLGSNNPVGMRRMPRPEYQARLDGLAQELAAAQAAYDDVRRDRP
jgi:hypothetical protein